MLALQGFAIDDELGSVHLSEHQMADLAGNGCLAL